MLRRHEKPLRRVNPSGRVVWVARWTDDRGRRLSAGTFSLKGPCQAPADGCCAQHAIWAAYTAPVAPARRSGRATVGGYAESWLERHPHRSARTEVGYRYRLSCVLDVRLDGRAFRDWPLGEVRRRQVKDLIAEMLVVQKRARTGALGILWVLSAMWRDAIDDDLVETNPFRDATIKASDKRICKPPVAVRVFSWEQMYEFARVAATVRSSRSGAGELDRWRAAYAEAMIRTLVDCGLRLGELLALHRTDFDAGEAMLHPQRTAWHGRVQHGTKTDHGESSAGRWVPLAPELVGLLAGMPPRIGRGSELLFAGVRGGVWQESLFYRDVWRPAQEASGLDMRPHEARHSYVSLLRASGIDAADLAVASGHTLETATKTYTHALNRSADAIRAAVGGRI